jgi:proteasome lid subunit RPN8/RPN11
MQCLLDDDLKSKILNTITICSVPLKKLTEQEQCGIIVNREAIALDNKHSDPCNHFYLSPEDLYPYQDNIQAIFHTHCQGHHSGWLSYDDIRSAQMSSLPIIVYHTGFDCWDYYDPNNPNPFPAINLGFDPQDINSYIGIHSQWGRSDCFAVARSFYLGMFNIDIGEFPRSDYATFPQSDYRCPWHGKDFATVGKHEPFNSYDALAIATRGGMHPNHVAILLPGNMILHSPLLGELSKVELYGNFWRNRTLYAKRIIGNVNNN